MKSSITKRWVRGSLLFTLAVVLVAEAVFLYFAVSGYYDDARAAINTQFASLQGQLSASGSAEEKSLRLIRAVEQFERKSQFELMLVRSNMAVDTTSSGILPTDAQTPPDIVGALQPGGSGYGEYVGQNDSGERVMACTLQIPQYAAGNVVALRLVTSLGQVDRAVQGMVAASVALLLAVVLASVVSGVYFIRSIVLPLQKVEATASRIARGDFETRIVNEAQDEIGQLCRTINHMAEELSTSERMKNEFISSVSHELRTPLTSIKGWAETVGRLDDAQNPHFRKGLDIIAGETDRLYEMVEELLDFSRMQDGLQLQGELLDLAAEVEDAVLLSGQRAAGLGVALLYTAPPLPVAVTGDRNRIRQVLVNVLDNAIKYSFAGGRVNVQVVHDEESACAVVADEGQGISPEDVALVRQKFYKGKGAVRGSGIGLAVADEIMQAHGGSLEIESELHRGTRVCLRWPLYHRPAPEKTGRAENGGNQEKTDEQTGKKNKQ